jgi:hypothetical protein
MTPPTCEQIFDEELQRVQEKISDWRHGARVSAVFMRASDSTFWLAKYRRSTDGETNELREGLADISQVEPYEVKTTEYRPIS